MSLDSSNNNPEQKSDSLRRIDGFLGKVDSTSALSKKELKQLKNMKQQLEAGKSLTSEETQWFETLSGRHSHKLSEKIFSRRTLFLAALGGAACYLAKGIMKSEDDRQAETSEMKRPEFFHEGICYEIHAEGQNVDEIREAFLEGLNILREGGIDFSQLCPVKKITIFNNPQLVTKGEVRMGTISFSLADTVGVESVSIKNPIILHEIQINYARAKSHLPMVFAHELLHVLLGVPASIFWHEGIAEGFELLYYQKTGQVSPDEQYYQIIRDMGLDKLPWNFVSNLDSQMSREEVKPVLKKQDRLRRHIGALFWTDYLKNNPSFIGRFIEELRKVVPLPQMLIPFESLLIQTSNRVDPDFGRQYLQQPFTKMPVHGQYILDAKIYDGDLHILSGVWHRTDISIENTDMVVPEIEFLPLNPVRIKVDGKEMNSSFPEPLFSINLPSGYGKVEIHDGVRDIWIPIN